MSIHIKQVEQHDVIMLTLLARITFTEAFGYLFTPEELKDYLDKTFTVAKLRESVAKSNNRFFLAIVDELPVAYAKLKLHSPYESLPYHSPAQLQKIYVLKEFIGNGIGEKLQETVFREAEKNNKSILWLAVWEENHKARKFYTRYGYHKESTYGYGIGEKYFTYDIMVKHFQ